MRLDFNVLWVDDQPERIAAQSKGISKRMEEAGFQFNSVHCRSILDVRESIGQDVFADNIDLILVDWDLGGGVHGQDAIAAIRETIRYKDIVFYSALNPVDTLRKLAFDTGAEGVFCSSREDLVDEVLGVFDALVKKVLDLDHTRGIVMGATSDIDNMVNECLSTIYAKSDRARQEAMFQDALKYIETKITQHAQIVEKLRNAASLVDCFEEHLLFTAFDRLRLLAGALKAKELAAHKNFRKSVVDYQQEVVPRRNKLGHLVLVPVGKTQTLAGKGEVVSLEETRELRRTILILRGDFRKLLVALGATGDDTVVR